jgi:hypothetical protein
LGCTVDADREIGLLREEHAPARPDLAWLWSITSWDRRGTEG